MGITKSCKNPKKNDWNPGTWILIWEYSARAIQWIPTWQVLDGFQKSSHPCALNESSLSIGRVKLILTTTDPDVIISSVWYWSDSDQHTSCEFHGFLGTVMQATAVASLLIRAKQKILELHILIALFNPYADGGLFRQYKIMQKT